MKVAPLVVRRTEQLIKFLGKDLRRNPVDASKVGAYSKLLAEYGSLVRLSRALEDEANNYYESMERRAIQDMDL